MIAIQTSIARSRADTNAVSQDAGKDVSIKELVLPRPLANGIGTRLTSALTSLVTGNERFAKLGNCQQIITAVNLYMTHVWESYCRGMVGDNLSDPGGLPIVERLWLSTAFTKAPQLTLTFAQRLEANGKNLDQIARTQRIIEEIFLPLEERILAALSIGLPLNSAPPTPNLCGYRPTEAQKDRAPDFIIPTADDTRAPVLAKRLPRASVIPFRRFIPSMDSRSDRLLSTRLDSPSKPRSNSVDEGITSPIELDAVWESQLELINELRKLEINPQNILKIRKADLSGPQLTIPGSTVISLDRKTIARFDHYYGALRSNPTTRQIFFSGYREIFFRLDASDRPLAVPIDTIFKVPISSDTRG